VVNEPRSRIRCQLLIIDDDADIVRALKKGLEARGFQVSAYNDPLDAVANFQPGRFEIILTDLKMPGMDGVEVYRHVAARDSKAKVAFLTSFDMLPAEFMRELAKTQSVVLLKKPISLSSLEGALVKLLLDSGHSDGRPPLRDGTLKAEQPERRKA
jgi:CheY-like chemotaxis protein